MKVIEALDLAACRLRELQRGGGSGIYPMSSAMSLVDVLTGRWLAGESMPNLATDYGFRLDWTEEICRTYVRARLQRAGKKATPPDGNHGGAKRSGAMAGPSAPPSSG